MSLRNLDYLATNPDLVCPIEFGYVPDCGSICQMMEHATGKTPFYIGKPETAMVEICIQQNHFSRDETMIVGDRMYTDILCGVNAGIDTALVLTGEATREQAEQEKYHPTFIFSSVKKLSYEWKYKK